MNKVFVGILLIVFTLGTTVIVAQNAAINSTGSAPDASAMLDVSSTSKGLLTPRMTEAQRTAIASPATGLLVYQTDGTDGFYYYDGSTWSALGGGGSATFGSSSNNVNVGLTTAMTDIGSFTLTANAVVTVTVASTATNVGRFFYITDNSNAPIASGYMGGSTGNVEPATSIQATLESGTYKVRGIAVSNSTVTVTNYTIRKIEF